MSENHCVDMILVIRRMTRLLDKYNKYLNTKYGVTLPQLLCLIEIQSEDSINLSTLTKRVNLNSSAITGIIDRMEMKGFVARVRKREDRRNIYLEITDQGRKFAENALEILENDCFIDRNAIDKDSVSSFLTSAKQIMASLETEVESIELG